MFDRIAPRYDLANHLLSGGCDYFWRAKAASIVRRWRLARVLDLACGSGDLARAIQRRLPQTQVVAADFSEAMLERARRKGVRETVVADALALPFGEGEFDAVTIAFGLRNVADRPLALREVARVLRPSGHVLILDFSMPRNFLRRPYGFYLHKILPALAATFTGARDAYAYLGDSIETFPSGDGMLRLIEQNGFVEARAEPLTGGIVTIYTAEVGT